MRSFKKSMFYHEIVTWIIEAAALHRQILLTQPLKSIWCVWHEQSALFNSSWCRTVFWFFIGCIRDKDELRECCFSQHKYLPLGKDVLSQTSPVMARFSSGKFHIRKDTFIVIISPKLQSFPNQTDFNEDTIIPPVLQSTMENQVQSKISPIKGTHIPLT